MNQEIKLCESLIKLLEHQIAYRKKHPEFMRFKGVSDEQQIVGWERKIKEHEQTIKLLTI